MGYETKEDVTEGTGDPEVGKGVSKLGHTCAVNNEAKCKRIC